MRKLDICIDLDETVNTLIESIVPLYNEKYKDNLRFDDITEYEIKKSIKPECNNFFGEFVTDDLLTNLGTQPYCVPIINHLIECHKVSFLTAGHPYTMGKRHDWLKNLFPLYSTKQLIMCQDKSKVNTDILIDDCVNNITAKTNDKRISLLLTQPWNKNFTVDGITQFRCNNWLDVLSYIDKLTK